ncbi:MAG: type II toxin-antitoxin system HipA family toxin [Hyphomicrobiales bacterium]|nr:type II toxin-antitoxin system HipA family toxin [Hyphomicrobiales bacterium]
MPRHRQYAPLRVFLNNRLVGRLLKQPSGAIQFRYDVSWLEWKNNFPISLSLPLREKPAHGEIVIAVFENLLPDSTAMKRQVAEKVDALGTDAYSLLSAIGRDCVGALQFAPEDTEVNMGGTAINGEIISDDKIADLLKNLKQAPLGLSREEDFRISIAGVQEKTALLRYKEKWLRPYGTTPTTHIFKTQIGKLPNGLDLSNSVENEFYCLKLMEAFSLKVNDAQIQSFAGTKALVIKRFDRLWTKDGRLLRLPQEDFCQALSVLPTKKYQSDRGPGIMNILDMLKGSDEPEEDRKTVLKAQILFWLISAIDGHAKNFSIFLKPEGGFSLTPLYDVLTAQPYCDAGQIRHSHMKLAMAVGDNNHYRIDKIHARHFMQTGSRAKLPEAITRTAIDEIADQAERAMARLEASLPGDFPERIHTSVKAALFKRLRMLR